VRRVGGGVLQGRRSTDQRGRARGDSRHRRCARGGPVRRRPGCARLHDVRRPSRVGHRRASRRHGADLQRNRRVALRARPREGGVRHRDAGRRHQHAGARRGDRQDEQVHRRAPPDAEGERIHPAHRPRGPTRHRHARARRRGVESVRRVRAGCRRGDEPHIPTRFGVPYHLQHGGQPRAHALAAGDATPAQLVARSIPSQQRSGGGAGAHHQAPERTRPAARASREQLWRHRRIPPALRQRPRRTRPHRD